MNLLHILISYDLVYDTKLLNIIPNFFSNNTVEIHEDCNDCVYTTIIHLYIFEN